MRQSARSKRTDRALRLASALMVLCVFETASAQLLEDYRFKGQVVDETGKPLADVRVTLRDTETGAQILFKTHSDGTFDRRMIPHAHYEALFEKTGYVTFSKNFDWSEMPQESATIEAKIVLESDVDKARRELGKRAATLYEECYAALAANDCSQAREKAQQLLTLGAGSYEYAVRFVLARCHAVQEELADAVSEYRRVLELKPDLFEAHFDLALVLEKQGEHEAALREYERAAELDPENGEVQYNLGAILFRQKEFDRARPYLEKATMIDSTHADAAKALGFAWLQGETKDLDMAKRYLERYLLLAPQAPDAAQVREILSALESSK